MADQDTPRRVKNAPIEKLSTQLFYYQISLIINLSKSTGWSSGTIYRYALDYFIVMFKTTIKDRNVEIPEELEKMNEKEIRKLAEVITSK